MKDVDFKDKSSPRIFGKGVVIVIVVLFSSLSFVLGYFVGKTGREDRNLPAVRALEAPVPAENPAPQAVKSAAAPETGSAPAEESRSEAPTVGPNQPYSQGKTLSASPKETGKEVLRGSQNDSPNKSATQAVKEQPKETSRGDGKDGSKDAKSVAPQPGQAAKNVYTVQLGALKNAGEAKRLRQKVEKKGYKTYLSVAKNKRHEKIYKIRVGEFKERKEAQVLALKLKKAEGLNTFVTVKN